MGVGKKIMDNHDTEEGQGGPDLLALEDSFLFLNSIDQLITAVYS